MIKKLNEAEAALLLIEDNRKSWLGLYQNPGCDRDKAQALFQLDRIDAYINEYFGKRKWDLITKVIL